MTIARITITRGVHQAGKGAPEVTRSPRHRGSVVMIVIWALALAALVTAGLQLSSFRQASLGRDSVERIQARWAARAGIEQTIAVMADHTRRPVTDDAFAMPIDMALVARGETSGATWDIRHGMQDGEVRGPLDEHSRMNINAISAGELMILEYMWLDIATAIMEWRMDSAEAEGLEGMAVGRDYYLSLNPSYMPRYGPYQNIAELELVAGVWPRYLRGEDWNLNNRLDPNENDGGATFPPDNANGVLDAGWSAHLTAYSLDGGDIGARTGEPRLYLPYALIEEVMDRIGVEELQARALIRFGRNEDNQLKDLLRVPISRIGADGEIADQSYNSELPPLTDEQLRLVFGELKLERTPERRPGRININTISPTLFRDLMEQNNFDPLIVDEILYMRDSQLGGISSPVDFQDIPNLQTNQLMTLIDLFCTHSNVYTISSLGRSDASGQEVEIIAVVDRSTIPIRILEYREQ